MVLVSISAVLDAAGDFRRPIVEGEAILNSGLLIAIGKLGVSENKFLKVWALCLQTSALFTNPHQIKVTLNLRSITQRVTSLSCSCKAGTSEKCKHAIAVLMYLNKVESEKDLEDLSCTDLQQQWGKLKSAVQQDYEAVPFDEFCHQQAPAPIYARGRVVVDEELAEEFANLIIARTPKSAAAFHKSRCRADASKQNCRNIDEEVELAKKVETATAVTIKLLDKPLTPSLQLLVALAERREKALSPELLAYYETLKRSKEKCILIAAGTCSQSEELWHSERTSKVTGSKIYELYTYSKNKAPKWNLKLKSIFNSSFSGNEYTVYGLECEPIAREFYATSFGVTVAESGLFVRPELPFLGYSADGIILDENGNPKRLWEVKSLNVGKTTPAKELFAVASCCDKKKKILKRKHKYFGQIQLGMLLLGLDSCHFMLHSSVENDDTVAVEEVDFDSTFAVAMVTTITHVFFDTILPWLFKNSKGSSDPEVSEV